MRPRLAGARYSARLFADPAPAADGQGTVEYVGLTLLVSLLMVGMVAAMKGFNRKWPLGSCTDTRGSLRLIRPLARSSWD